MAAASLTRSCGARRASCAVVAVILCTLPDAARAAPPPAAGPRPPAVPVRVPAPAPAPAPAPTATGSLAPGVTFEDVSITLRPNIWLTTLSTSPHDPEAAWVATDQGHIYRTRDGGRTWDELHPPNHTEPLRLFNDGGPFTFDHAPGQRIYPGAVRGIGTGGGGDERASRLPSLVARRGYPAPGVSRQALLAAKANRPTMIWGIIPHDKDPRLIYTVGFNGLLKTTDGGDTWTRVWFGQTTAASVTWWFGWDPGDPRRLWLATSDGLYVSEHGEHGFMRLTAQGLSRGTITWVTFHPGDPKTMYVALEKGGVQRTRDGGRTWQWIYWTAFPTANLVRRILVDRFDGRRGYLMTHDGLFVTDDLRTAGLESWRRLGAEHFTGLEIFKMILCPKHPGHFWVETNRGVGSAAAPGLHAAAGNFIYETIDGGQRWQVLALPPVGQRIDGLDINPRDPDLLWIAWTDGAVTRLRRGPARVPFRPGQEERRRAPLDPTVSEMLAAVMSYTHLGPALQLAFRRRAPYRALLPRVDLSYSQVTNRGFELLRDGLYPTLPYWRDEARTGATRELRVVAVWDLAALVFAADQPLLGRTARLAHDLWLTLYRAVSHYHSELRRVRTALAAGGLDLPTRIKYRLRVQELTSLLDRMSGGYLSRWHRKHGRYY